jgi:hypothetical protein
LLNCLVDQLSVDQLSVDQLSVDQLSVDQLSVDQLSVDQMFFDQKTWNLPSKKTPILLSDSLKKARQVAPSVPGRGCSFFDEKEDAMAFAIDGWCHGAM